MKDLLKGTYHSFLYNIQLDKVLALAPSYTNEDLPVFKMLIDHLLIFYRNYPSISYTYSK